MRQNYTEDDIGENKAEALARRLRALTDAEITVVANPQPEAAALADVDLLIDATVSLSVGHMLDEYACERGCTGPTLASTAIDSRSATLGLLIVATSDCKAGPATIDRLTEATVLGDTDLVRYHSLWQPSSDGDELIPARGCSTPTFHGSAADLAGAASVFVNLLGQQMKSPSSGTYLFALPFADGSGPSFKFVGARDRD